ncbi:MAG TPA: PIN domain-containing protein [Thermoanaerobaculia bacterium]|nr:PIN domain-containing protein [Thermoanaerobaculia bacterium]
MSFFADTGYLVALVNPRDELHRRAQELSALVDSARLVTTEMVLTEVLNHFSKSGERLRRAAVALIVELRDDSETSIVPQSSFQFQEALTLYGTRSDKDWSHTDCASFQAMKREGITDALTHDRHFEQAGFRALLRD